MSSPDSRITAAYKAALGQDMAQQLKGFSVMCRYFDWKEVQKHIALAHEQLITIAPMESENRKSR
jgi:hypothetical protein